MSPIKVMEGKQKLKFAAGRYLRYSSVRCDMLKYLTANTGVDYAATEAEKKKIR